MQREAGALYCAGNKLRASQCITEGITHTTSPLSKLLGRRLLREVVSVFASWFYILFCAQGAPLISGQKLCEKFCQLIEDDS